MPEQASETQQRVAQLRDKSFEVAERLVDAFPIAPSRITCWARFTSGIATKRERSSFGSAACNWTPNSPMLIIRWADWRSPKATTGMGMGMGMVCGDFNGIGATDIFIANDMHPNFLFENDESGRFTEVSLARGVAYNFAGKTNGNMGVDCGDINEMPILYRNLGGVMFEDATQATGAGAGSLSKPAVRPATLPQTKNKKRRAS